MLQKNKYSTDLKTFTSKSVILKYKKISQHNYELK